MSIRAEHPGGQRKGASTVHTGEKLVEFSGVLDLPRTLGILQRGTGDPSLRLDPSQYSGETAGTKGAGAWLASHQYDDAGTPLGASVLRLDQLGPGQVRVRAAAESDRALETAIERAPGLLGAEDDWTDLDELLAKMEGPTAQRLRLIRRRHPGVRLPASRALFEQLSTVILEQKVTHDQARHSWRHLLRSHGDEAQVLAAAAVGGTGELIPSTQGMRLPPTPEQLLTVSSWQWHQLWVQPALAHALRRTAERAPALHRLGATTMLSGGDVAELAQKLQSIPGIGAWTAAETLQRTHGAADLVAVGDYHLAHCVGEALTGRRTDDAGMLELLEPFRPHRQRIVRLIGLSGLKRQRYGPRLTPADHRRR